VGSARRPRALTTGPTELVAAPGLLLWRGFVQDPDHLMAVAWRLGDEAAGAAVSAGTFVSPDHNLPNRREQYVSLTLNDTNDLRELKCEHFSTYGEGHELTYFRGTHNLPSPIIPLVERLEALPAIRDEVYGGRARLKRSLQTAFQWRLTLNRYMAQDPSLPRPGFPWHRDIEANGASTMILGLGTCGRLQFAEDPAAGDLRTSRNLDGLRYDAEYEPCVDLTLAPGDLLVLSGKSRWEMIHRVAPEMSTKPESGRASLVFGCW